MKIPFLPIRCSLAVAVCCFASSALLAEDITPPVVQTPIADFTVSANSAPTVLNLKKTFALQGVSGKIVRMATTLGNIDIGLATKEAPNTVANFLSYVNGVDTATTKQNYNGSFIHRVATLANAGVGVIQGGGYATSSGNIVDINEGEAIASEASISNTRGTIAVALTSGPNTGTNEWFINDIDNPVLDGTAADGPFTVFGRVVNGLSVVDAIAALKIVDAGNPFNELPVLSTYNGTTVMLSDLVYVNSVTNLPLVPKGPGEPGAVVLKIKGNTNPGLVTPTLSGRTLTLTYAAGQIGSATIMLLAKDPSKSKAQTSFTVTVQ